MGQTSLHILEYYNTALISFNLDTLEYLINYSVDKTAGENVESEAMSRMKS